MTTRHRRSLTPAERDFFRHADRDPDEVAWQLGDTDPDDLRGWESSAILLALHEVAAEGGEGVREQLRRICSEDSPRQRLLIGVLMEPEPDCRTARLDPRGCLDAFRIWRLRERQPALRNRANSAGVDALHALQELQRISEEIEVLQSEDTYTAKPDRVRLH